MKSIIKISLATSIIIYAIAHFMNAFCSISIFDILLSISGILIIFLGSFYLSPLKFKLPIFILLLSISILIVQDISILEGVFLGVRQMQDIIGLLVVIPLISWVFKEEKYAQCILNLLHPVINTSYKFYLFLIGFTQINTYFLLFGSISTMYQFENVLLHKQQSEIWQYYKGTAVLRGFSLSALWVISMPSFIFAVETLEASLWISIIQGGLIAFLATLLAYAIFYFQERKYEENLTVTLQSEMRMLTDYSMEKGNQKTISIEFILLFISLFGTIFLLHAILQTKLMILIPLTIVIWVITFYIYKKRYRKLLHVFKNFSKNDTVKQSYQVAVMIAVGILIYTLKQTSFSELIIKGFDYIQMYIPFLNPLVILPLLVVFLGFYGLGPLTVMVLVAEIVHSMSLPYSAELIVLSITSGSVLSILLSPLVIPIIMLSENNKLSLLTNGIKFNWKYALSFYLMIEVYLQTMLIFFN